MPDKKHYDELLIKARALQAEHRFSDARDLLNGLVSDENRHLMGEITALGLPRRLHSAMLRLAKDEGDVIRRTGYQYTLVPPPEVFEKYGAFSASERQRLASKNRETVPKIIHQIWIGDKELPVSTAAWEDHARKHGYEYRLWREADLESEGVTDNAVFANMLSQRDYPGAVDVARYIILERLGGIYLDCDFYPARDDISFHDLLPLIGLSAFAEEVPRKTGRGSVLLANSFIAAPPGHPVFTRMLAAFPDILAAMPKAPAWWATGPLIFTVVARAGSVCLADAGFVAASLPDRAAYDAIKALRAAMIPEDTGLLIAWKSW